MSSTTNPSALYTSPATQQRPYIQTPPSAGYPAVRDNSESQGHAKAKSKGDDFSRWCCAALRCCCRICANFEETIEFDMFD